MPRPALRRGLRLRPRYPEAHAGAEIVIPRKLVVKAQTFRALPSKSHGDEMTLGCKITFKHRLYISRIEDPRYFHSGHGSSPLYFEFFFQLFETIFPHTRHIGNSGAAHSVLAEQSDPAAAGCSGRAEILFSAMSSSANVCSITARCSGLDAGSEAKAALARISAPSASSSRSDFKKVLCLYRIAYPRSSPLSAGEKPESFFFSICRITASVSPRRRYSDAMLLCSAAAV